jgi:hypothetical protein
MRALIIAVALAPAPPAWAANDGVPNQWVVAKEANAAAALCVQLGGNSHICSIRSWPTEMSQIEIAKSHLNYCDIVVRLGAVDELASCAEARAYIKQRWGY